jgi:GNAT superfamily N-acetyltransferase
VTQHRNPLWEQLRIREATIADLDTILHHRWSMFQDMGCRDQAALRAMQSTSMPFFAQRLSTGAYHGWLVEEDSGRVVAGGGVLIFEYHSSPFDPLPRRPMIVNLYTDPAYRRIGIAGALLEVMIKWCREEGFGSVMLHASDQGRPLYQRLGFLPTNEMRLMLR